MTAVGELAIELRPLEARDLPSACGLHLEVFPESSTRRFLERVYYPAFVTPESSGFGFVAVRDLEVVGLCVAASDDARLHRFMIRRHPVECARAALRKLLRGRRVARRGALRPLPRLHYLAVSPLARGRNLGTALSLLAQERIRLAGHASCWTAISRRNAASIVVHERMGFRRDQALSPAGAELDDYRRDFGAPARVEVAAASPRQDPRQPADDDRQLLATGGDDRRLPQDPQ